MKVWVDLARNDEPFKIHDGDRRKPEMTISDYQLAMDMGCGVMLIGRRINWTLFCTFCCLVVAAGNND